MTGNAFSRLVRAGVATGVTDALFAVALAVVYGSTVTRLWQGVASTVVGRSAFEGGARTALLGVAMHFAVAFTWSLVFLFLVNHSSWIRSVLASPFGVVKVAAVYGPAIWLVMSLIVVPLLVQRAPTIAVRWWIQLAGHVPFVGLPIVASMGAGGDAVRKEGRAWLPRR
jgi:hypothetical protein